MPGRRKPKVPPPPSAAGKKVSVPVGAGAPNANPHPEVVKLNVGGRIFATTRGTLLGVSGGSEYFFKKVFSGEKQPLCDEHGAIFIDGDPDCFSVLLNYLRTGHLIVGSVSIHLLEEVAELLNIALPKFKHRYRVTPATEDLHEHDQSVEHYLNHGWQLTGGVSMTVQGKGESVWYSQAVTQLKQITESEEEAQSTSDSEDFALPPPAEAEAEEEGEINQGLAPVPTRIDSASSSHPPRGAASSSSGSEEIFDCSDEQAEEESAEGATSSPVTAASAGGTTPVGTPAQKLPSKDTL